jgi:hypothetical protein
MDRRQILALLPLALAARAAHAQAAPEILARYPNGTFLENLLVQPDGTVLFTSYFARAVESWSPAAGAGRLAEVPGLPVSLTALGDGRHALVVHGAPFTGGAAALRGTTAVLLLDPAGAVTRRIAMPEAVFPNGALLLAPGLLLVADSALGRIWAVSPERGTVEPWLDHPEFQPDPALPYPGLNGIKRAGGDLLLSNSARRRLLRLGLSGAAPSGVPELRAAIPTGIDDFAVAADGTVYAATHAEGIAVLPPGATTPRLVPAPGVEGSTAVALTPDARALYALGTGEVASGGRGDAVLARIAIA